MASEARRQDTHDRGRPNPTNTPADGEPDAPFDAPQSFAAEEPGAPDRTARARRRAADARDQVAAERDRVADERERIADERERLANQREALADQREDAADARDIELDKQDRGQISGAELEQPRRDDLERARARIEANDAAIERNRALIRRLHANIERLSVEAARQATQGVQPSNRPAPQAEPSHLSLWQEAQRHFVETALQIAETEDEIALNHEQMASRQPDKADEFLRVAREAREEATRARKAAQGFSD